MRYENAGKRASVRDWLDRLPADVLATRGDLMTAELTIARVAGRADALAELDTIINDGIQECPVPFAEGLIRFRGGDAGGALPWVRQMVAAEAPDSDFWPSASVALGRCLYYNDELDESAEWLHKAGTVARAKHHWRTASVADAGLSMVATQQGDPVAQQQYADEAFAWLEQHNLVDAPEPPAKCTPPEAPHLPPMAG